MENNYFFKSATDAAVYVYKHLKNPTPIKIQKGLYFLWAFYAATYGNLSSEEGEMRDIPRINYPSRLFKANFEAWRYGPVINEIWKFDKDEKFNTHSNYSICNVSESTKKEILGFINDMLIQIDNVNDFGLVKRSHQDNAWKSVYKKNSQHLRMNNEEIVDDYTRYVEKQSEF